MKRLLTKKQVWRTKFMCLSTLALLLMSLLSERVAAAVQSTQQYDGPYIWHGEEYSSFKRVTTNTGYIDEYTNNELFCRR